MAITEAVTATGIPLTEAVTKTGTASALSTAHGAECVGRRAEFRAVPVWFFAFEGLMGAAYDIVKSSPDAWIVLAVAAVVNIALARTVLRGRLKMPKAMLKGRRTRRIAVGLIALRLAVHVVLGAAGVAATTQAAHMGLAVLMCGTTVGLLAFDQRVMLRALAAEAGATA
jgi:hypothetical protein